MSAEEPHAERMNAGFNTLLATSVLVGIGAVIHHLVGIGAFARGLGLVIAGLLALLALMYVVGYVIRDVPQHARRWWE